jgi:hypothetical protein
VQEEKKVEDTAIRAPADEEQLMRSTQLAAGATSAVSLPRAAAMASFNSTQRQIP